MRNAFRLMMEKRAGACEVEYSSLWRNTLPADGGNNEKANIEIVKLILHTLGQDESLIT